MKKYKLIKEYPGSKFLGNIEEQEEHTDNFFQVYKEFYEEVIELKFKVGDWVIVDTSICTGLVHQEIFKITGFQKKVIKIM